MSDREESKIPSIYSRRTFLGKTSLGLAAALALGFNSGRFLMSPFIKRREPPTFPSEDSIFTPRKEPPDIT